MDADDVRAEVRLWLATLRAAGPAADRLPAGITREVEAQHSAGEMMALGVHVACMSTTSRQRIERTLAAMLMYLPEEEDVTPTGSPDGDARPSPALRLVVGEHP